VISMRWTAFSGHLQASEPKLLLCVASLLYSSVIKDLSFPRTQSTGCRIPAMTKERSPNQTTIFRAHRPIPRESLQ
jgi:hypothetical protein